MSKINPETLHEISGKIHILLKEYGLEPQILAIDVLVGQKQYKEIMGNFPENINRELSVGASAKNWSIDIRRSLYNDEE